MKKNTTRKGFVFKSYEVDKQSPFEKLFEIQIENNILFSTSENLKKNQQIWKRNCHV